jgi:hypothetical protein
VRPRRLEPGDRFTWRFKSKDYWEAMQAPRKIETVEELMALHEPWVTSGASQVLRTIEARGGEACLDEEGLIVVDVSDERLDETNAELGTLGCRLSNESLHVV